MDKPPTFARRAIGGRSNDGFQRYEFPNVGDCRFVFSKAVGCYALVSLVITTRFIKYFSRFVAPSNLFRYLAHSLAR